MPKKESAKRKLTRQELRDLDIEISFIKGVVRRDPKFVEALQVLGDDYTRRGSFKDGLKVDQQLARLRPEDSTVLYNLACSFALIGRLDRATNALLKAIDRGYNDFRWLMRDPDLQQLRDDENLFKKVREKVRSVKIRVV
jgi:tetratricopeptide (TPR) repeat protein